MSDSTQRFGEFLIKVGELNDRQVAEILKYQQNNPGKLFGQIAVELGFITDAVLNKYLKKG
jgi:hypothetical protein